MGRPLLTTHYSLPSVGDMRHLRQPLVAGAKRLPAGTIGNGLAVARGEEQSRFTQNPQMRRDRGAAAPSQLLQLIE